jgi:transposase
MQLDKEIARLILPSEILKYFEVTKVEEFVDESTKLATIHIELEEINSIPAGYDSNEYESKGFYPVKTVQDFPLRGKPVYLLIKRRRWRHKINKNEIIHNDYSLFAVGSKITQELSDFLKDTGRDPNRYHW